MGTGFGLHISPHSLLNMEPQPATRAYLTAHLLHILHKVMRPAFLDLLARVARAHRDDGRARRDARADAGGRVLEDDAALRVEAEALGGEEEGVRSRFTGFETFVVGGDGDGRRSNTDTGHATIGYEERCELKKEEEEGE